MCLRVDTQRFNWCGDITIGKVCAELFGAMYFL